MTQALTVLIVGGGAREHAMSVSAYRSPQCARLLVAPGNAGSLGERHNILADDVRALTAFCQQEKVDLVLVGPEAPLAAGLVDALQAIGVRAFGPTRDLARLESSKSFSRELSHHLGIPGPLYAVFNMGQTAAAIAWWRNSHCAVVVKQSGLAGGKGVIVPNNDQETEIAIRQACAVGDIVLEEKLTGPECSLIALCDGTLAVPFPIAQDHKRIGEGDTGSNTGGMGAYAPADVGHTSKELCGQFIQPMIDHLQKMGTPYIGVLYAGLMMTTNGPRLLEYNCRFGDPEAQVLFALLETDIVDLALQCIDGDLNSDSIKINSASAMAVVIAAHGYPQDIRCGDTVLGLEKDVLNTFVFHGGTKHHGESVVTASGRVLTVVGIGDDLASARDGAYKRVATLHFEGAQFRRDIGWRAPGLTFTTYAAAGVNIDEGNRAVSLLKASVSSTGNARVLRGVGSFGGALDVSFVKNYDHPVLVASTDGVGTKVDLAAKSGRVRGVGMDIVNHCVNDVLVQGAKPMFFLDYLASSHIKAEMVAEVVDGMAQACIETGCILLGGETAEMPGVYQDGAFDIAGTLVGIVEREQLLPRDGLSVGDVLIALQSSGPHTNGYSLLRRIFQWLPWNAVPPPMTVAILDALLEPHRSYLSVLEPLLLDQRLKALIHITGGGLPENLPRVLPDDIGVDVHLGSWDMPPLFQLVEQMTRLDTHELYRTLNMGVGMVLIVAADDAVAIQELIAEPSWIIGELVDRSPSEERVRLLT